MQRLEEKLRDSKRQASPFAGKGNSKAEKGGPGRKPGKGQFKTRQPPPESKLQTVRVPLHECPCCGGSLQNKKSHQHIQSDIPPVEPVHIRFLTESGYCPQCGRRFRSRHPDQSSTATGAAGTVIGPNAKAIATDMKHRLGISYEKIAEMFKTVFGLKVSPSSLCRAGRRLAQKGRPLYGELLRAIRNSPAAWVDETGWRIGGLSAWLWAFTSPEATVYTIRRSRGHEVVTDILGPNFEGVLHSDCFMAYDSRELQDWTQQRCLAHLIRQLRELARSKTRGAVRFPRNVLAVLRNALKLGERKKELSFSQFERQLQHLQDHLDRLICEERNFTDPDNHRFAKRLRRQRHRLFTFLTSETAEPTNNRAERAIRPGQHLGHGEAARS